MHPDEDIIDPQEVGGGLSSSNLKSKGKNRQKLLEAAVSIEVQDDTESEVDLDEIKAQARKIVRSLYGEMNSAPSIRELVRSILEQKNKSTTEYQRGDWVEYLGRDMKWKVAQIRGVVKQAPDEWDWNDPDNANKEPEYDHYYNVGGATLLPETNIRATEQGLKCIFGSRPWVWQQYAFLRLEKHVRFQQDHERDFREVDCQKFADDLFHEWLHDEKNEDFLVLYKKQTKNVQDMLLNHLITPFELLDQITESDDWEFEDADMSIYTYVSVLGSGSLFALFCFVVQITIPVLLLLNALEKSDRFHTNLEFGHFYVIADMDELCKGSGSMIGKLMVLAVLSVYILTVIPDSLHKFYRTTGDSNTTYSRINSLRQVVWEQGDDTFSQQVGFKMDRYMNTAFVCILYSIMLFILFNTDEVLDIILNALAGEFIHQIDEQVAAAEWYDEGNRWLNAGAWQLVLQASIRLRLISNPAAFCRVYDIDPDDYSTALGANKGHLPRLKKASLAKQDDNNPRFMSAEDVLFHECALYSRQKNNDDGVLQFEKKISTFSFYDFFINRFRSVPEGVFDQYCQYRTWSRWEEVIFLSRIPNQIKKIDEDVANVRVKGFRKAESSFMVFLKDIFTVMSCGQMYIDISSSIRKNRRQRLFFHVVDGLLQWFSYLLQITFPALILLGLFFIPFCY